MAKVPNTITDAQAAELSRRAQAANPVTSARATRQRKASQVQRGKADQN